MTTNRARTHWRITLLASVGSAALALAPTAHAQSAHPVHIAAGPLDAALLALAAQTHEQLLFTPELVAGRRAPALAGSFTTEQALSRLLGPADISVTRAGPAVLVLRRRPPPGPAPVAGAAWRPEAIAAHAVLGAPPSGAAADAAPARLPLSSKSEPVTLKEIEVTGSHLRGAPPASPLLVLSHAALERTGQTTVADALRALPENFGGVAAEGNSLTGADGVGRNSAFGTGLNLRGLGNGATLVLVDGHRQAGSGTFGDFVDVSTIPMSAVERVEVLLDGASAVYGSDAVGGVVNIILRKDYDGGETRLLGGGASAGGAGEFQVSQLLGRRWTGGGMVFDYEHRQRGRLTDASRDFAASADLRGFGGGDYRLTSSFPGNILGVSPTTNALVPRYAIPAGQNGVGLRPSDLRAGVVNLLNQRQGEDLLPRQTQDSVYLAAHQDLTDRLQVTADARYSFRLFDASQSPATTTLTVGRSNPFYVAPTGAATESIGYSFASQLPNPVQSGSVQVVDFTVGATLRLAGDWRSEASATLAQETDRVRLSGFPNSLFLNEALGNTTDRADTAFSAARDGYFNPFTGIPGANSPAVLAFIGSGGTFGKSRDQVSTINLQADGTLWRLPGGPLKLAVGARARREELLRNGYNLLSTVTPAPFSTITDVSRDVTAAYLEARIPLFGPDNARPGLQRLELSLAGRLEHYSSFGTTANPTIGLIWDPVQAVRLRATYSRSFRAPALRELYDPSFLNPVLLSQGTSRVRTLELTGGNPDLKPETADSWTGGIDFKPERWPGLELSFTGFDIRFHNRIDRPASVNIANALSDPTLTSFVQHISPATNPADLALINTLLTSAPFTAGGNLFQPTDYGAVVDVRYVNTSTLHVRGVDFTGRDVVDLGDDRLTLGANATYLLTYDQQFTPTSAVVDRVNVANYPLRFRGRLTADWTRGRCTLGGALNYVGAYHDSLGERIGDQHTVDLQAQLAADDEGPMKGVTVQLSIRNLFDAGPPFYDNSQGFAYDPANADPIGRFVSLQLTRAW